MKLQNFIALAMATAALITAGPAWGASKEPVWVTLGTNSGPDPNPERSEAANLLLVKGTPILVDAGDGASVQLAKAGVRLTDLHTVVISHLHFDHTAGLFGIIGERYQLIAPGILTIYGPPGTKLMVDGLLAAMATSPQAGARARGPASQFVHVIEVTDGSVVTVAGVRITAAANSHYSATPGGAALVSLSFRFDAPGRSIVFTGDTGPSEKLERLAQNCDLLVSEIIDVEEAINKLKQTRPDVPAAVLTGVRAHFAEEHLTGEHVGELAAVAHAKSLVITHNATPPGAVGELRKAVFQKYRGPTQFARDLDRF